MKESEVKQVVPSSYPMPVYRDDTIDLIDLFAMILKRKYIVWISIVVAALLGTVYILVKQPIYLYTTTISIGSRISDDKAAIFEATETVKSKVEKSFIPTVLHQYARNNPGSFSSYKIVVAVPKNSGLIILTSKASAADEDVVIGLQQAVTDMLAADHQYLHNSIKLEYQREVSKAHIELDYLTNDIVKLAADKTNYSKLVNAETNYKKLVDPSLLAVRRKAFETNLQNKRDELNHLADKYKKLSIDLSNLKLSKGALQVKIEQIQAQLADSLARRGQAVSNVNSPTQAMTMLMIDNEIQQSQRFLMDLEHQMRTVIPGQLSDLSLELSNNRRKQQSAKESIQQAVMQLNNFKLEHQLSSEPTKATIDSIKADIALQEIVRERKIIEQKEKIKEIQLRLDNLKPTRSVVPPMRSLGAQGVGGIKLLALSVICGLLLGLCLVFYLEFMEKVRQRKAAS